jgi:hypothetical protein
MVSEAARRLFVEQSFDPLEVDALVYFESTYKDYPVWQAALRTSLVVRGRLPSNSTTFRAVPTWHFALREGRWPMIHSFAPFCWWV